MAPLASAGGVVVRKRGRPHGQIPTVRLGLRHLVRLGFPEPPHADVAYRRASGFLRGGLGFVTSPSGCSSPQQGLEGPGTGRSCREHDYAIRRHSGPREVNVEQLEGQTYLNIKINRLALARYGSSVDHVQEVIEAAIGGRSVGELIEGQRRFDILVKLPEEYRGSMEAISNLLIDTPQGGLVPLSQVADIRMEEGPSQVSREDTQRRIVVEANVEGRDIGSFAADAQRAIKAEVRSPTLKT